MELNKVLITAYKGKKIFLTGHTGFKGSWLLLWLKELGAEIKGYALHPGSFEEIYNQIDGDSLCHSVIADIRDKDRLKTEIIDFEPDFIFHLAAQPLVRRSYEIPVDTFEVNALGTGNLLDALRFLKKKCSVVLITTDKVYENKEWVYPYRETDRLGGYDPYSASKAAAEIIINSYKQSFFNPSNITEHQKGIAVGRAGNVIGGGDWSVDRIIPDIVRALQNNESILVRNPSSVRPWQHVLEPLCGYLQLGAKLSLDPVKYSEAFNFGPFIEDTLTVEELVKKAIEKWGAGNFEIPKGLVNLHEAGLLKLDINKAIKMLDWCPKWNANLAIEHTLNWYKNTTLSPVDFSLGQINSYLNV